MSHRSVLLQEAIEGLNLSDGDVFLDCTLGSAGHTLEIFKRYGLSIRIMGIDADSKRIESSRKELELVGCKAELFCENFRNLDAVLEKANVSTVNAILFDLGLNSEQLESSGRGFSFLRDEPLLMTFGEEVEGVLTAREIVNHYDEASLAEIFEKFGEERQARNIARAIVESRKVEPIKTTFDLVEAIRRGYRGKYPRSIHFATRTFQALRIAVNDEFEALKEGLEKGFGHLAPGGRMVVISFHSLEDGITKKFFKECAVEGKAVLIVKKPRIASETEKHENPRARSAKLRILEKTNT